MAMGSGGDTVGPLVRGDFVYPARRAITLVAGVQLITVKLAD